jgi:hypothetical protein
MDCPDRLLPDYAGALKRIHALVPRLSITALEGWIRLPSWPAVEAGVDEVEPMFYDTQIDPPVSAAGAWPLALVDPAKVGSQINEWRACKAPWRAGLPNFARLTLYDGTTGASRGHPREWDWDDLCFSGVLTAMGPMRLGTTVLRASEPTHVQAVPVESGALLGVRWPDRQALAGAVAAVKRTSALGVVYFRLPDSTDQSGWSLRQLGRLEANPNLVLRISKSGDRLELRNQSDGDLEPRLVGKEDRGYALELDAPASIFREAMAGDFWEVAGCVDPQARANPAPIPLATRLSFLFSHLRAGQSLETGLLQLAPGADFRQVRYRFLNTPQGSKWNTIGQ